MTEDTKRLKAVMIALLLLISWAIYINTTNGDFIKDDIYQVLRNEWIRSFSNAPAVFFGSVWDFLPEGGELTYYRPMMHIFYMFSYKLSELNTWGYHLVNILLHSLNSVMVFLVALKLFRGMKSAERATERLRLLAAFLAALIFATHTVNTEVVAWVAAVPELSFTLFGLLSFYLYINKRYKAAVPLFLLSLFSKETAMVVPILIFLYAIIYERSEIKWFSRFAPYGVMVAVYSVMRVYALEGVAPGGVGHRGLIYLHDFTLNAMPLLWVYMKKLAVPVNLIYFSHIRHELIYSFLNPRAVAYMVATLIFFWLLYRLARADAGLFLLASWALAPLIPVMLLGFIKGGPVFAERYLYLSTAGLGFFVMGALLRLWSASSEGRLRRTMLLSSGAVLIVVILFSVGTVKRNYVWNDSLRLWEDVVTKAPENMTARLWYGNDLIKRGRVEEAIAAYREAIKAAPPNADTLSGMYNNLGIAYAKKGMMAEAVESFRGALRVEPENTDAAGNLQRALHLRDGGRSGE